MLHATGEQHNLGVVTSPLHRLNHIPLAAFLCAVHGGIHKHPINASQQRPK